MERMTFFSSGELLKSFRKRQRLTQAQVGPSLGQPLHLCPLQRKR